MRNYIVTYTDPNATYPAPKQTVEIQCSTTEIWNRATSLGLVHKIYEIGGVGTVYSINWKDNYLGVTTAQVNANLGF